MNNKIDFTKRKFLSFLPEKQHKKCAEILRIAYEASLHAKPCADELNAYQEIGQWLNNAPLVDHSLKTLADRYHFHLKQAFIKHKEHNLLPPIRRGDKSQGAKVWPFAFYFDQIRSAHNVGSMLRTIEAFSLGKAYFSKDTPFSSDKQVQAAAMGACEWVECHSQPKLEDLPRPLIALETSPDAIPLFEFIFPETFTLAVGNEEYGCSDQILAQADLIVEIPLRGRKNSLNVANAFAIAAAEIYRQKNETNE